MARAFIALGSNCGDRTFFLTQAVERIKAFPSTKIMHSSQWVETVPFGVPNQEMFLNGAIEIETELPPAVLFKHLQQIEKELGRPAAHSSSEPRVIDLDLLFYDDQVIDLPDLRVPHPKLHERPFVLFPLAEIAPSLSHPQFNKTISELLNALSHETDSTVL